MKIPTMEKNSKLFGVELSNAESMAFLSSLSPCPIEVLHPGNYVPGIQAFVAPNLTDLQFQPESNSEGDSFSPPLSLFSFGGAL